MHMYIYTHKQNQKSPTKIKYNRLTWQTKENKNYIYQNKPNYSTNWTTTLKAGANWRIKQ